MMKEFSTIRDLEKRSFSLFKHTGGGLLAGFILTFFVPMIGIPLMIISAVAIIGCIVWVCVLGRESSNPLFCPYCSSKNDVFSSRRNFDCDICGRQVLINDYGEPAMAEAIDTEARYDR